MKIIKLLLLLSLGLWAEVSPKTPRCIEYETIKNVLTKGWEYTDQNLTKWVEKDGENFLKGFKTVIEIPLRPLTNEEYLQKQMDSYEETKKFLEDLNYKIRTKEKYRKYYELKLKYDVVHDRYTNHIEPDLYSYTLVMIKYFESQKKDERSYDLYKRLLIRLIVDIKVHGFSFFQLVTWQYKEEELFGSLKNSLSSELYTQKQKSELFKLLSQLLLINNSTFNKMMQIERNFVFNFMHVAYIENQSFDMYIKYDSHSVKKAIKMVDKEMLKRYFEDKMLMQKLLNAYQKKHDVIYQNLLNMESKEALDKYVENIPSFSDFLSYTDMTRLFVINGLDKIGLTSLANVFQYELNENEFVEVASQFFITSGKPWVLGKYKFEWEEIVKQNEGLLKQSLN